MRNQRGSHMAILSVLLLVLLAGALGYVFWNNNLKSQEKAIETEVDIEPRTRIARTTTLGDWTVSLDVPDSWKIETKQDSTYNYDTGEFVEMKNVKYIHPSGTVEVRLIQIPFYSGDGTCGPSAVRHMHKEPMPDPRLTYVEMVLDKGDLLLSPTSDGMADFLTEDYIGCFNIQHLIANDGSSLVGTRQKSQEHNQPFVGVSIHPSFVDEEGYDWDPQKIVGFLATDEYKEAKAVVKSLKL